MYSCWLGYHVVGPLVEDLGDQWLEDLLEVVGVFLHLFIVGIVKVEGLLYLSLKRRF